MREGKHPGIVQLQHTYLSSSIPCLEYEYVDGGDLTGVILEWHRSQGGATVDQAARTIHRLAEIVGYAHRLTPPIVHRDLKPANILVHKTADNEPYFKVADFGIGGVAAGRAIQQATQGSSQGHFLVSSLRGSCTELYASPQQRQGDLPDPRDDVFALGVIWYQLLTGRLDSGRPGGSRWKQSLADKGMSSWMVKVLERCLEDNPDDRPKDAATLAKAIPRIYVLSGKSFFEDEEYGQAIRDVTIALTLDPELANVECYRIRGIAYCECEQWDEAISDLTNWIRFAPNSPEAFVWKGEAYAGKEAYDEAICDLSEAIRQDTSHLKAYCSRGDVFRVTGDYQRAIADYTDALALVENDDARQNYILLYARFYTTLHDDLTASNNALVGCRYSLRQQVLFDRASCYEDLGDLENALNDYRRSECGYDEAIAVCNRLIDADPGRATELQPMIDNLVSRRDRHLRSGKGTHSHERIHDPLE
jgi:serine/threonine protein kinase